MGRSVEDGAACIVVVDAQLYLGIYYSLHSLISPFSNLTKDFIFILLWIWGFVYAQMLTLHKWRVMIR